MKRIVAAVILLIIIGAMSVTNTLIIKNSYNTLHADIEDLKSTFTNQGSQAAKEKSAEFEEKWVKLEDTLSIFVNHELITDLGISVAKLPVYAETADDMFLAECRSIELELLHMLKDTDITLHSIF